MKLLVPIIGAMAVCGCTLWVLVSHAARRRVMLHNIPCSENKSESV